MKKALAWLVILGLVSGSLRVGAQVNETHSFTNLNQLIPDGHGSGLHDVRTVNSAIDNLGSVRVRLRIAGQFNGDLYGYVRQIQGGTTNFCVLLNRVGRTLTDAAGYADAGLDVVFDDTAAAGDIHLYRETTYIPAGSPLTGTWQPDGRRVDPEMAIDLTPRTTTLGSFAGVRASGAWTLYLADVATGGTNMLVSWALEFTGVALPTVTWPTPTDLGYGGALSAAQLNATSSVPGSFVYTPPLGTILHAGSNQVLSVTFTPTDTASYLPVTTNVSLNVLKAPLIITAQPRSKTYGDVVTFAGTEFTTSGLTNGDTVTSVSLTSAGAVGTAGVVGSPYAIVPSAAVGSGLANYAISYVNGALSVTPAATTGLVTSSANPSLPGQSVTFTLTLSASAASGLVQFKINGTNAGSPVALNGGVAGYASSTLTHGTHAVQAEYAGDENFTGTTNMLSPAQLINTPPVAGADIIERDPTNGVKVSILMLLTNDSDADSDLITYLSVSASSANGGTVVSNAGWIFYTPAVGFTNTDTFSYTISDGVGVPVNGLVTVNIRVDNGPSPNLVISDLGNGSHAILGDGVPGRTYRIQFVENVGNTNWLPLGTVVADTNGLFQFIDSTISTQRFFRSVNP